MPRLRDGVDHNQTRKRVILPEESSLAHAASLGFRDSPMKVISKLWHWYTKKSFSIESIGIESISIRTPEILSTSVFGWMPRVVKSKPVLRNQSRSRSSLAQLMRTHHLAAIDCSNLLATALKMQLLLCRTRWCEFDLLDQLHDLVPLSLASNCRDGFDHVLVPKNYSPSRSRPLAHLLDSAEQRHRSIAR